MIQKRFDLISESDIRDLISNATQEGKTIDYKRTIDLATDEQKREFLADISSFANTNGGDLVLGVEEDKGVPTKIVGLVTKDIDKEMLRMNQVATSGLSPRIRHDVKVVPTNTGAPVLVVRVERSWSAPHRVLANNKFFARNSSGKYPLDVDELRAAFLNSASFPEKARAFRSERVAEIAHGGTQVPMEGSAKVVIHVLPFESFIHTPQLDLRAFKDSNNLMTMKGMHGYSLMNFDGVIAKDGAPISSYCQIFRSGVIEAVDSRILNRAMSGMIIAPGFSYEQMIVNFLPQCVKYLKSLGLNPPLAFGLSLVNLQGVYMGSDSFVDGAFAFPRPLLQVPEILINDYSEFTARHIKPALDLVWNAVGIDESPYFDDQGNFRRRL